MRAVAYSLGRESREALLRVQTARREAARPRETDEERRARESEAERQHAVEAARAARSEAERLVGEELARLIGIERSIVTGRQRLKERREELAVWRDTLLGWQRRVRDAKTRASDEVDTIMKPWSDEDIGNLLRQRSTEAAVEPIFDDLLEKLPPAADELDQQEALASKQAGCFRMVWDFVRGNPALVLEVWRASLVEDADGTVRVRSLQAPDATQLEALPDSALFVLRAILQMAPASAAEVAQAARLTEPQVRDAFSFGQAHGYLIEANGRMSVSWAWHRAVVVLLKRRHLLVNS